MDITLTPLADLGVAVLPPDILWSDGMGDFAIATDPADGAVGGFVSGNPLSTAVKILLFTDSRYDVAVQGGPAISDPRGWPGDGFGVNETTGEAALGSLLWRLRRQVETRPGELGREAQVYAEQALAPLIAQGVVDRIETAAASDPVGERVKLTVALYSRERRVFAETYDPLWGERDGGL